jgi:hypothetical protein
LSQTKREFEAQVRALGLKLGPLPTLPEYFVIRCMPRMVEKSWLGRRRIRFGAWVTAAAYLYESTAVLGRAYRDDIEILAEMFCEPGQEREAVEMCRDWGKYRLEAYDNWAQPEWSFPMFAINTQLRDLPSEEARMAFFMAAGVKDYKEVTGSGFDQALGDATTVVFEGIGLGILRPDLVEAMYRRTYEQADESDLRKRLIAAGLEVPAAPDIITLEEREMGVRLELQAFASDYYPHLLQPLGLD